MLNLIGIEHEVNSANIDETPRPREAPRRYAERLAREKAATVAVRDPDLITIGADTVVVINRKVLGKPTDTSDAALATVSSTARPSGGAIRSCASVRNTTTSAAYSKSPLSLSESSAALPLP